MFPWPLMYEAASCHASAATTLIITSSQQARAFTSHPILCLGPLWRHDCHLQVDCRLIKLVLPAVDTDSLTIFSSKQTNIYHRAETQLPRPIKTGNIPRFLFVSLVGKMKNCSSQPIFLINETKALSAMPQLLPASNEFLITTQIHKVEKMS